MATYKACSNKEVEKITYNLIKKETQNNLMQRSCVGMPLFMRGFSAKKNSGVKDDSSVTISPPGTKSTTPEFIFIDINEFITNLDKNNGK